MADAMTPEAKDPAGARPAPHRRRMAAARLLLAAAVLSGGRAHALGRLDLDLELDAYYSALGLTVPFSKEEARVDAGKAEAHTYRELLSQGLVPRFMVIEASVNPFPVTGWLLRRHAEDFYHQSQVTPTLNLVEAVTAGFEEPYALALFLGNVVDFAGGKEFLGRSRKGYIGYLASAGNYHLMNNLLIPDNWLEVEGKIKGDQKTDRRKMSWSFRGGRKFHANREIRDVYYVAVRRSRVDYEKTRYSFLLSSAIEYRFDFDYDGLGAVGHNLMVEKNFPIPGKKWAFSLGVGYLWRSLSKYSGSLGRRRRAVRSQIMLRPNLRF
ncbi:MAG: hypothetical protein ABII00_18370 [Elusimicrobiota bacterium]